MIKLFFYQNGIHFHLSEHLTGLSFPLLAPDIEGVSEVPTPDEADFIVFPSNLNRLHDRHGSDGLLRFLHSLPFFQKHEKKHVFWSIHDATTPLGIQSILFKTSIDRHNRDRNAIAVPYPCEDLLTRSHFDGERISHQITFAGFPGSSPVREALLLSLASTDGLKAHLDIAPKFHYHLSTEENSQRRESYLHAMASSFTALCPRGDGANSIRFFEALSMGRMPVLVADACLLPGEDKIDYDGFILRIPEGDAAGAGVIIRDWLAAHTTEDPLSKCRRSREVWERYFSPDGIKREMAQTLERLCSDKPAGGDEGACIGRLESGAPSAAAEDARLDQARRILASGDAAAAERSLYCLLAETPLCSRAYHLLGHAAYLQGRMEETETFFRKAIFMEPHPAHYKGLGLLLHEQGRHAEAVPLLFQAVARFPDAADLHAGLGDALAGDGRPEEAADHYRQALALQPDHVDTLVNLGVLSGSLNRLDDAVRCLEAACSITPDDPKALMNLGAVLQKLGRLDEAETRYRQALAHSPHYGTARWNLAQVHLLRGDYAAGWRDFDARFEKADAVEIRHANLHRWKGEPLSGKRILVWTEQAFGDTLQFCRFLPLLQRLGATVFLENRFGSLHDLLLASFPDVVLIPAGAPPPVAEFAAPLLSLPGLLGITLDTLPCRTPYLVAGEDRLRAWGERLGDLQRPRIGLVWAGRKEPDPRRTIPLPALSPLAEVAGINWVSLQIGEGREEIGDPAATLPLMDVTEAIRDFADTAALIAQLDLVITIDTSVAHLAGALGKPVWVMLPFAPDWRWLLEREDSPWYPAMRLFRQKTPGEWQAVVDELLTELRRWHTLMRQGDPFQRAEEARHRADEGDLPGAIGILKELLRLEPASAARHYNLANLLARDHDAENAADHYRAALRLDPGCGEAAISLAGLQSYQDAQETLRAFLATSPGFGPAWYNLALAQLYLGNTDQAEAALRSFVNLEPEEPKGHNLLGIALQKQGRLPEAVACYERAISLDPDNLNALNNLGAARKTLGDTDAARELFLRALAIDPKHADSRWNLALLALMTGDFTTGWQHYEARWEKSNPMERRRFDQPQWNGEESPDASILLYAEQGYGDTIQFVRYAALVARRCRRVIVECQDDRIKQLLSSAKGVHQVVIRDEFLPAFDCHASLMSLPGLFNTTLQTIPADVPYLAAPEALAALWRERLAGIDALRIGLIWSGRPEYEDNRNRSLTLALLEPLLRVPGTAFFSLQLGEAARQLHDLEPGSAPADLAPHIHDFCDSAAIVSQLELIISVDSAPAHLAGALGRPAWVLLPFAPDWRWMLGRNDSPWYPGMRLYRQTTPGKWEGPIERMRADLEAVVVNRIMERAQRHVETMEWEQALTSYEQAIAVSNGAQEALLNAAACHQMLNRHDQALACYDRILAHDPDHVTARCNRAFALLSLGRYGEGWEEYEWRQRLFADALPTGALLEQRHLREGLAGARVLIHAEQAFGDMLQFIRYAALVAEAGATVTVTAPPELARLFVSAGGVSRVVPQGEQLPPFDYQGLLLSLPRIAGTTLENIPRQVPYLFPDEQAVGAWSERLGPGVLPRIGLVWSGNRNHARNFRLRSIPFEMLLPLMATVPAEFVSLQIGAAPPPLPGGIRFIDPTGYIRDFADTAALITRLDLVLTIDTAVAHLAGALGKPVWTLVPSSSDWRWCHPGDRSLWYPTMQLFRQERQGDWGQVIERITAQINRFISKGETP